MNRILLIGNNREVDSMTIKILRRNGYFAYLLGDTLVEKPNLIIIDCEMSPKEGFKKYQTIINNLFPTSILWISSEEKDEIDALEYGADDWIKKPYHIEVLLARIKKLCKRSV